MASAEKVAAEGARFDDLSVLAAMELMDLGWEMPDIAAALLRPVEWIKLAIEKAISDDAKLSAMN